MNYKNYKLKTVLEMRYELKNTITYGLQITRNIIGFNITMKFKPGICAICINNIEKLNYMLNIDKNYRDFDFDEYYTNAEYREIAMSKLEYILDKIKEKIEAKYYNTNEMVEDLSHEITDIGIITVYKKN